MEDYYRILGLNPQSSIKEIEDTINTQYNQVRRLVNHHDQQIVNQTNQALIILGQMKVILLDPQKKAEYDLGISNIGGLADTNVITENLNISRQFTDEWFCPNCQLPNPKEALFCQYCSKSIGRICPNCQTQYAAKAAFCPKCGNSFELAIKRNELAQEFEKKQIRKRNITQTTFENTFQDARYFEYILVGSFGWSIFMGLVSVLFIFTTFLKIIFSFFNISDIQTIFITGFIGLISGFNTLLLLAIWAAVLFLFVYLVKKRGMVLDFSALIGYCVLSLLALIFQGRSLIYQILGGYTNHWLIFLGIVAAIIIGFGGYLFSKNAEAINSPEFNNPWYEKIQSFVMKIFAQYDKSVWAVTASGIGLSFLVSIFSASRFLFIGIIAGIISLAVSFFLLIMAYRANRMIEIQKSKFANLIKFEDQEKDKLENEIIEIQKQINFIIDGKSEKV